MSNDKNDIYSKLNALDRRSLNTVAHDLGMKGCYQQEKHELIDNILKNREEDILGQLNDLNGQYLKSDKDIYLKLNGLDPIMLNVVAHDLGIKDYSRQDRHELIENIMRTWERKAILRELDNDWDNIFLKLNELNEDKLNAAAKKLGIKNYARQESHDLIVNIMKYKKKEMILKALKVKRWPKIFEWYFVVVSGLASIIALLFYTDIIRDVKEFYSPSSVTTTATTTIPISARTTVPPDTTTSVAETTDTEPKECYDSLSIDEAERFFSSVRNAPAATYDENSLPPGFDKTSGIGYRGKLKVDSGGKITGEMKFLHKKSGNIFTLNNDGVVSPGNGDEWTEPVTGMEFVWISGRCFGMGCNDAHCEDQEKPAHEICVDGFWMGKQEVNQGQWEKIMGNNPSVIRQGDNKPVQNVSWDNAMKFISKLNELNKDKGETFRLPGEAEWEYACQNEMEIADMKGGVQEWCEDIFGRYGEENHNTRYPGNNVHRVVRGGSQLSENFSRCSYRKGMLSHRSDRHTGFRLIKDSQKNKIPET